MPSNSAQHEKFLRHAVQLSAENIVHGKGGPFGAVIVKDGKIIAEGSNCVTTVNDPTAHAEIEAIRSACKKLSNFSLKGCEIYTSCEPCPMCLGAIYWARIDKIYFANSRKEAAAIGFDDEFIYMEIPKPINERSIPLIKIDIPEALEIFRTWQEKEDKTGY